MGARLIGIATRSMISRAGGASGPVSEDLKKGAQAGGRLVLRRALPENDAAAAHQALLGSSVAKVRAARAEELDLAVAGRNMSHRPLGP